jgi:hypothetical protein
MKIKDEMIKAIECLDAQDLALMYDQVLNLTEKRNPPIKRDTGGFERSQKILSVIQGSLADDILREREETL